MASRNTVHMIRALKCLDGGSSGYEIPIRNKEGKTLGAMRPIDTTLAAELDIQEAMTKWRRMFMRSFFSQFTPSVERTKEWLQRIVLASDDRILFLIYDADARIIGHFGVCNISVGEAELDNLIRGEKGGDPDLIYCAELSLLRWIFFELDIPLAVLHVFSNNFQTIALHQRVGFSVADEKAIWKKTTEDGAVTFSEMYGAGEKVDFSYVKMALSRREFEVLHS